jgi:heat-inducible transcriptional repressor
MQLNERYKSVLEAVVDSYIHKPVPVGSRYLAKAYTFSVSSATIRNIMADLEEMGFLEQPHTSAGRIPTDSAYRYYVDALKDRGFAKREEKLLASLEQSLMDTQNDITMLLNDVTAKVSDMTNCLAFAIPMRADNTTLNRIQLYRYKGDRTVAVLLTNEGLVTSKVLYMDFGLTQKELDRISDFLNSEYSSCSIHEIRASVFEQMSREKELADVLITKAMQICREALVFPSYDIIFSGVSELIGLPEFADQVDTVARAIEDKHSIINILDGLGGGLEANVVIGQENPDKGFRSLSIVTSEYSQGDRALGRVGMIGSTRMDYSNVIPMVEVMARYISSAF